MGEALREGDCLGKGMAQPQSLLGKKGDRLATLLVDKHFTGTRKLGLQ